MERSFEGRAAVVTGAGAGLGRAYALGLAARGCSVVVNDLSEAAETVAEEIRTAGGTAIASRDSVATREGGAAMVQAALDAFSRLDIVISNAGILRSARFEEMTEADIDDVIAVHLKGAFNVCQPAFAAMKKQGYGRILLASSSSGVFGHPWQASYGAAKTGLVGLTNVIAIEGKDHGILCNAIMPNARTAMTDEIDFSWLEDISEAAASLRELGGKGLKSSERMDAEWVAPLALHLVSEASDVTQGVFSAVNGRYAKVTTVVTEGWCAPTLPQPEDIAAHWQEVENRDGLFEPANAYEESGHANDTLRSKGMD